MRYCLLVFILVIFSCNQKKKYHDDAVAKEVVSSSEIVNKVLAFQKKMNEEFKNPDSSPLPDRYRKDFEGLDFYEPDTNYRVQAKFVRTPEAIPFMMLTTTEREAKEIVYGIVYFHLNGENHQLEVYQSQELQEDPDLEDYLFLPFIDETNGEETYGGGRYIDLKIPEGDAIIIDFNKAYNPYCAYNKKFSCPIVQKVNTLNTEVFAGVKAFKK
ncbi:MAG: DUF1684 domain-containing protein [Cellulophaga sp.]